MNSCQSKQVYELADAQSIKSTVTCVTSMNGRERWLPITSWRAKSREGTLSVVKPTLGQVADVTMGVATA